MLSGQLSATDGNDDALTYSLSSGPLNGSVTVNADGSYAYTPNADYNGADAFTYAVADGRGGTDTGTVAITVAPVNDAPRAVVNAAAVDEDGALSGQLNAVDPEGDGISYALSQGPAHGALVLQTDGSYAYSPNADYAGSDSFTFTMTDTNGATSTGTASITVTPVNDAPVSAGAAITVDEDQAVSGQLAASDVNGDALTFALAATPANGTAVVNADGSYTFTPNADWNGTDSFTYTVSDGNGGTTTAAVSVTVNAVADAPVAAPVTATVAEDEALSGQLVAQDVDGDALTFALASGPANGSVTVNGDGSYVYTPNAQWSGTDIFTFTVDDGTGLSDTGTVTVDVTPVADAPTVGGSGGAAQVVDPNSDKAQLQVPLAISPALIDNDGSEVLSVTVAVTVRS